MIAQIVKQKTVDCRFEGIGNSVSGGLFHGCRALRSDMLTSAFTEKHFSWDMNNAVLYLTDDQKKGVRVSGDLLYDHFQSEAYAGPRLLPLQLLEHLLENPDQIPPCFAGKIVGFWGILIRRHGRPSPSIPCLDARGERPALLYKAYGESFGSNEPALGVNVR